VAGSRSGLRTRRWTRPISVRNNSRRLVISEMNSRTGKRVVGEQVNLERAMAAHVRFGGHFVQAHVDTTVTLVDKTPDGDSIRLTFELADETMLPYLVPKGYVALDGASLTLTFVDDEQRRFGVMLITHTQEKITLGRKEVGSRVNLEVDMLGKYVQKSVAAALRSSK
jgi:riboflavin synthase